jgi:hypothetical protein
MKQAYLNGLEYNYRVQQPKKLLMHVGIQNNLKYLIFGKTGSADNGQAL